MDSNTIQCINQISLIILFPFGLELHFSYNVHFKTKTTFSPRTNEKSRNFPLHNIVFNYTQGHSISFPPRIFFHHKSEAEAGNKDRAKYAPLFAIFRVDGQFSTFNHDKNSHTQKASNGTPLITRCGKICKFPI